MTVLPSTRSVGVIDSKPFKPQSPIKAIVTWCSSHWKAMIAEFMAMVFLILFGCMTCIPTDGVTQHPMYAAFGFGLVVMVNVQIFGHLSGAYMNPLVATIACIFGRISVSVLIAYVIIQCLGSIVGYGILITVAPYDVVDKGVCLTLPHANLNVLQAVGIEMMCSAFLSLVNCALWDPHYSQNQDSAALKHGLTVTMISLAGGPWTGSSMNPARTLGPSFWTGRWDAHWAYWVGPLVGGILPAIFYKYAWLKKPEPQCKELDHIVNKVNYGKNDKLNQMFY